MPGVGPPPRPRTLGALGDYEIVRKLGAGGMGIVYLARRSPSLRSQTGDAPLTDPNVVGSPAAGSAQAESAGLPGAATRGGEDRVAIKVLQPELAADPRMVRLFLKEAKRLQALDHPGIVKVIEVGADDRESYFVMPYLAGGNLGKALRPGTPADPPMILRMARGVGTALKHIHDKGLVHGDVKPANILLDQRGVPVLADLGLARRVSSDTWVDLHRRSLCRHVLHAGGPRACGR